MPAESGLFEIFFFIIGLLFHVLGVDPGLLHPPPV
jgi:hypothetical protein